MSFFSGAEAQHRGHTVRTRDWRYISSEDGRERLYAVLPDPWEENDLAAEHPRLIEYFRGVVQEWRSTINEAPTRLEITGRLIDDASDPIEGASLRLEGPDTNLEVLTGRDGHFRFQDLEHGTYRLTPGRGVSALSMDLSGNQILLGLPVGPTGRHVRELVGIPGRDRVPAQGSSISGRLAGPRGEPLTGVKIRVRGRTRWGPVEAKLRTGCPGPLPR